MARWMMDASGDLIGVCKSGCIGERERGGAEEGGREGERGRRREEKRETT